MNPDEEYVHFQESITSLNRAWRTLCELEKAPSGNAIWSAAYRMVIVEYCKPFTNSQINESKRHKLPAPSLTDEGKKLHARLLDLRNQVMAHSDLSVLDAKVCYDQTAEFPVPLIVQNVLGNLPIVSEVKNQVEAVLDTLYQQEAQYELRFRQRP
ncbi:hypothetical protein [Rheinheimera baltica]|uniref:hypothetical protein n=1 Tax=Rheinheimera baltica TaxID=67576 RepID=UPI00273E1075|nr:hypothetical protein [Rheinheimera baltica]MDP5189226.1 hypothetical protein [Rheinheimera baltica]